MKDASPFPPDAFQGGAAYVDGRFLPLTEARIPVTDWGYRRSDVIYDVVGVWDGNFFRLPDHLARFRRSMEKRHLKPQESDAEIAQILHRVVALSGLKASYVAMDCVRGAPPPGMPRHPAFGRAYLICYAAPWAWVVPPEMQERGAHLMIPKVRRIDADAVDPTAKNFHWADLTEGQFEAQAAGADFAILLDAREHVTEGAGFNVFMVRDGRVITPDRGALEGVTRTSVLELCAQMGIETQVRPISAEEFRAADEIFLTTTAGGVMPAARIDGRIMGNDRPGPISMRIKNRFWAARAEGWHATPVDYSLANG